MKVSVTKGREVRLVLSRIETDQIARALEVVQGISQVHVGQIWDEKIASLHAGLKELSESKEDGNCVLRNTITDSDGTDGDAGQGDKSSKSG